MRCFAGKYPASKVYLLGKGERVSQSSSRAIRTATIRRAGRRPTTATRGEAGKGGNEDGGELSGTRSTSWRSREVSIVFEPDSGATPEGVGLRSNRTAARSIFAA